MARPQRVLPRRRAGVPHILHQRPRRRGDGDHLELPRHHAARPTGDLGGLAGGLPPDPAVQVVELARQLRRRGFAQPEVGRGVGRWRSRLPKARRRDECELNQARLRDFQTEWRQPEIYPMGCLHPSYNQAHNGTHSVPKGEKVMQFALLIYESPEAFASRKNPAEADAYLGAWRAYHKALVEAGVYVG